MNYDVFVSYCSEDRKIADALVHHLEGKEIRCWIDHRDLLPGFNWRDGIIEALEGNPGIAMVLLFSSASNKSRQVIKEISMADEENILVIPVRIENILPEGAIKLELQGRHWLDAFEGKEDRIEKAAERINQTLTRYSEKISLKQDSVPKSKASRPAEKELAPATHDAVAPVNTVSASNAPENVPKIKPIKPSVDSSPSAFSQLHEKIGRKWQNANKKAIFIVASVIFVIIVVADVFIFIPAAKDQLLLLKGKLPFLRESTEAISENTEAVSENTEAEQAAEQKAEIKPNVASLRASEVDFIFVGIRIEGSDVTLTIRIRNNSKKEKSVALYDITKKSWVRSKLIDKMGKGYEVGGVNFSKGGKKITSKDAGTKGVVIKPHEAVSASLHFKKVGNDVTLINLHPFIYTSGLIGSNYTEHDLPLIFGVTQ
ncbi:MAG: toll/interleukin-1 receptor domain-containing protein [Deltaproteobacteria bacterium]